MGWTVNGSVSEQNNCNNGEKLLAYQSVSLLSFTASVTYLLIFAWLELTAAAFISGYLAFGAITFYFFSRKSCLSKLVLGNIYSFITFSGITALALASGGVESPVLPFVVLPIVAAYLFTNSIKNGVIWTFIVSIVAVVGLIFVEKYSTNGYGYSYFHPLLYVLSLIFFFIFMSIVLYGYEFVLAKKNTEIFEQNKKLSIQNQQLSEQKEEIKAQFEITQSQKEEILKLYEDVTSSVKYAKRIQAGFLPGTYLLNEAFSNFKLFYSPKNIVSGDFYWWKSEGKYCYVAAADCTGHGVPGAFLTLVGRILLDKIIDSSKIELCPAAILENLYHEFNQTINSQDNSVNINDGMELSLIRQDKETGEVIFCGAKRPLWRIHNGVLEEIKGTRKSIGGRELRKRIEFENHQITVVPGDILLMFSDGIPDQFGGANDKKYMLSKMRDSISTSIDQNLESIWELLLSDWNQWKGDTPQTDDVLMIGLEI